MYLSLPVSLWDILRAVSRNWRTDTNQAREKRVDKKHVSDLQIDLRNSISSEISN